VIATPSTSIGGIGRFVLTPWGIFEYYGRRAEELEARRKPPP